MLSAWAPTTAASSGSPRSARTSAIGARK